MCSHSGPLRWLFLRPGKCSPQVSARLGPSLLWVSAQLPPSQEGLFRQPYSTFTSTYPQPSTPWPGLPPLGTIAIQHAHLCSLFTLLSVPRGFAGPCGQPPGKQVGSSPGSSREAVLSLGLWVQTQGLQLAKDQSLLQGPGESAGKGDGRSWL